MLRVGVPFRTLCAAQNRDAERHPKAFPRWSVRNDSPITIVPMLRVGMPFRALCVLP